MTEQQERAGGAAGAPPGGASLAARGNAGLSEDAVWRLRHLAVVLIFGAVALNTDDGYQVADTKLDLVLKPTALLGRALDLWDPLGASGQLQNQGYGYLFPMGPFFLLARMVQVPEWVVQRAWWVLLLSVSYFGLLLLARRMGFGGRWPATIGAFAFALAPHALTLIGPASIEVWPPALAPWILLPLVGAFEDGRLRRAAFLSGLAVLCTGGVNATVDLAAVLPAGLWLITRRPSRDQVRLLGWWVLAVFCATLWWLVPLVLLGRYSPPFLDFIETAATTTGPTSLVETVRGTADWLAFLQGSGANAGWQLLTSPPLVLATGLVAALGLIGIAWSRTPHRVWLVACLVSGVLLVTLGHKGPVEGFGADTLRVLLDGPLAPLRNVHKFDILVRLPLALGLVSMIQRMPSGATARERRVSRGLVRGTAAALVLSSTIPFFALQTAPGNGFTTVPDYWSQAADWLGERADVGRALMLPGTRFGWYTWGRTGDEPMQALASSAWDVRNAVPLTNPGHIRWLDAIERDVADGRGSAATTRALSASGFRFIVVRNDVDFGAVRATRPVRVHQAVSALPGVQRVAAFGPVVGGQGEPDLALDQRLNLPAPAIEIYSIYGSGDPRVGLYPASAMQRMVGGAESVVTSSPDERVGAVPSILASDADASDRQAARTGQSGPVGAGVLSQRSSLLLTDTPRRRETSFGVGAFGSSQTLSPDDPLRLRKKVRDYGASDDPGTEAVARVTGARLSASSSLSDADAWPATDVASMPYAAFDGSARTAWRPDAGGGLSGAWLQADLDRPRSLRGGRVLLGEDSVVISVTVTVDGRSRTLPVEDGQVRLPDVTGRRVRITLGTVGDTTQGAHVAIYDVRIPGVDVKRTIVMPSTGGRQPDRVTMTADIGRDGCAFVGPRALCAPAIGRGGEDAAGLDRTFELPQRATMAVAAWARPQATERLRREVTTRLNLPVTDVSASSSAVDEPSAWPASLIDGDLGTAWVADPNDPTPTVTLRFTKPRRLTSLRVLLDGSAAATRPTMIKVLAGGQERNAFLDPSGTARFPAITARTVQLQLRAETMAATTDPYASTVSWMGIGVSELSIPGLTPRVSYSTIPRGSKVSFPCGSGPDLDIGGHRVRTAVTATLDQVVQRATVPVVVCDGERVTLDRGPVRVRAGDEQWTVSRIELTRQGGQAPTPGADLGAVPGAWENTHRTVSVSARSEPSVLVVHENANAGWGATLDGERLQPVTVDGWQQGYLVPPGESGTVRLDFGPARFAVSGMLAGVSGAMLVLAGAFLPQRRRRCTARSETALPGAVAAALGAAVLTLAVGAYAVPALVLGAVLALVTRRRGWAAPAALTGAAVLAAMAILTVRPFGGEDYAANTLIVQLLMVVGLAAVVTSLLSAGGGRADAATDVAPPGDRHR